jgi:uncharacterized repeat protein (TIGR02543 family)
MTWKFNPHCWLRSAFTFLLLCSATLDSQAAQSGDFAYDSTGNTITITGYVGSGGALTIPSTIVDLPVTIIGKNAFSPNYQGMQSITSVTIPNSVTSIGDYAFYSCYGLTSVTIPSSVTSIGENVFANCSSLTIMTIPSNVSSIGAYVFSNCSRLTSITIPNSVTSMAYGAFSGCSGLTSITFPNSVTSIGDFTFSGCSGLTSITIPNSVTSIGNEAFYRCSVLASVTIPNSVTSIGRLAFRSCPELTSVTIGSGVTSIGEYAFQYCSKLTSVTIGSGITSIGGYAFQYCPKLTSVYFQGIAPSVDPTAFKNIYPTIYYDARTTGWGSTLAGCPTAMSGGYLIQATCDDAMGAIVTTPNQTYYITGSSVTVQATPKSGYVFTAWSGAATFTNSSIVLTMNANQDITANFAPDLADNDGDGLTNYNECVVYGSNSNAKDSNGDGIEDGKAVALGYSPTIDFTKLMNELKSNSSAYGLYSAAQVQSLSISSPLLTRDAVSKKFKLTLKAKKSTDLKTFTDLPFSPWDSTINAQGEMEFQFTSPDNAAFYRLEAH